MSRYIEEDLGARIRSGAELPARLTLHGLAAHYGVSITPVRAALSALTRQRLIRKFASGRLEAVSRKRRAKGKLHPEVPGARQDWTRTLAADVLRRSLKAESGYLREEITAAKYGVGRTVVRQTFGQLVGAGLLEHVPRHGWRIRPFREEELDAYLEVREIMELKALDLARPHLARADLERMLAGNVPDSSGTWARLDNELHGYLIEKSGNRFIQDFFQRHGTYFTTLFDYAALGASVTVEMAAQHRAVLKALLKQNWTLAQRALAHHIRSQRPVLQKMMERLAALPLTRWPGMNLPNRLKTSLRNER